MILKYFSTPNLNFEDSWNNTKYKIKKLKKFDKFSFIFWFLGPLVLLIERDPSDLWLTLITVLFLTRSYMLKEWEWIKETWFRIALTLWIIGIISGLISSIPLFSTWQAFVWIRFPLYALAVQAWLGMDRDIRVIMFLMMILGTILMCLILLSELYFEPTFPCDTSVSNDGRCPKFRLVWPYGDAIPGSYLSKANLSVFCVLVALTVSIKSKKFISFFLISVFTLIMSFLTGERVNFISRIISGLFSCFVYKPLKIRLIILLSIIAVTFTAVIINKPILKERYTSEFASKLNFNSGNWGAWRGGLQQGLEKPVIGFGPSMSRYVCKEISKKEHWLPGKNYCGNHPHNFYIQIFAETGFLGLLFGALMFFSIFYKCFNNKKNLPDCPLSATSFLIPLICFFPIQQFGSFYGQWGNIFIWFAIGFALSSVNTNMLAVRKNDG